MGAGGGEGGRERKAPASAPRGGARSRGRREREGAPARACSAAGEALLRSPLPAGRGWGGRGGRPPPVREEARGWPAERARERGEGGRKKEGGREKVRKSDMWVLPVVVGIEERFRG